MLLSCAFIYEFRSNKICSSNYLFLEVSYSVLVGISKEIQNRMFNMVVLEMVHQMCSITLTEENKSNIMLVVI